jgi:hypothetical protein
MYENAIIATHPTFLATYTTGIYLLFAVGEHGK